MFDLSPRMIQESIEPDKGGFGALLYHLGVKRGVRAACAPAKEIGAATKQEPERD